MITNETKETIRTFIKENPDGVNLTQILNKVSRDMNRSQLRTMLDGWYFKSLISRIRTKSVPKETYYLPFNGISPIKRELKIKHQSINNPMLNATDFRTGRKYQPFLSA